MTMSAATGGSGSRRPRRMSGDMAAFALYWLGHAHVMMLAWTWRPKIWPSWCVQRQELTGGCGDRRPG
jgi:hypothetical protein